MDTGRNDLLGEIAREGGGIAGDVDHCPWRKVENGAAHFRRQTGGGRIDDQRR